jgi:hypothetical protein
MTSQDVAALRDRTRALIDAERRTLQRELAGERRDTARAG